MPSSRLRRRPRPRSQERPLHDLWRSLVASDLELVWKVQGAVRASPPWVQSNLTRLVSHHPLRDISVVTWFAFLLGCRQFDVFWQKGEVKTHPGFHFFWACCINLVGAGFLRLVLSAPRPFMYDQRLRPLADRYETSHGLPSLETHMATVVAGWWAESGGDNGGSSGADDRGEPLVRLIAVSYICFVGFTRVYACSRFVHQVALSFVSGVVGLILGWRLSIHLDGLGLIVKHHVRGTAVVLIIALGVMAYHIENNDSQLMGIKKQEYLRVLANIVNESRQEQSTMVGAAGGGGGGRDAWGLGRDAPWDGGIASPRNKLGHLEERRDSFHFLQKTVEQRASERAMLRRRADISRSGTGGAVDRSTASGEISGNGGGYGHPRREGPGEETRGPRGPGGERFFAAAERAWGASLR